MKFLQSTTDTILAAVTMALIGFTAFGITDPKDFITFVSMVSSYKFGKAKGAKEEPTLG